MKLPFSRWRRLGTCVLLAGALLLTSCSGEPGGDSSTVSMPEEVSETESIKGVSSMEGYVYCAVGTVDEAAKTARVLMPDGEITTIQWEGDAPTKGAVNLFKKEGDTYSAERAKTYPPIGAGFETWEIYASGRQKRFSKTELYYTLEETVYYVRYSDTEWRVFKGRKAMKTDANTKAYLYYTEEIEGIAKVVRCAMVVGEYGQTGKWAPANAETTKFLDGAGVGWDQGDKDLS